MKLDRITATLAVLAAAVTLQAQEHLDLATLHKIKTEAFENSKVMETEFNLTDVHGPRLTNSPQYFEAADWAVKQLTEWGIKAHQEKWPFGRGWQFTHYSAHLIEPQYAPLIGYPQAWTKGTNGTVTGEPIWIEGLNNDADLEKYKGQLKGKIVLIGPARDLQMSMEPLGHRFTEAELHGLFVAPDPGLAGRGGFGGPPAQNGRGGRAGQAAAQPFGPAARAFRERMQKFLSEEGPLVVVQPGPGRSEGGDVFGGSAGSYNLKDPEAPPTVVITPEHYNRIVRLMEHKIPVKLEFNIQTKFQDARTDSVNIIGEIEGGRKKDEVVMLGAHFDSWHGGTGATDNAAGSAVMMEAIRILRALNLNMDRTVRIGLWGGEEEGLLGSKAYVKEHFGDPQTMQLTSEHAKLSGYFNVDNGTGKIRGVYLQGNDMMRPVFEQWFASFKDLADGTISIRNTGGTDHLSFDALGLPGFQFIQDPMEYGSRTHHSNMDVYDRIQKGDMMQMSAIVAAFVYNTAMRQDMLPRKPLPKPQPSTAPGTQSSSSNAQGAIIVQPGAPGQNSKILSPSAVVMPQRGPSEADTKFMQGMIMHHAQAVEMTALLRTRSHNKAVQALGKRISISQTDEIKFMKQWLADRGKAVPTEHDQMAHMGHDMNDMKGMAGMNHGSGDHGSMAHMDMGHMDMGSMPMMPGMLTPQQMEALAKATGPAFDHLFLTGMIQHHTGALVMVQDLFDTPAAGQDNQLFDFATDVDNTQRAEINIMQGMLKEKK